MLQFGFLSSTFWWAMVASNMVIEVSVLHIPLKKKNKPTKRLEALRWHLLPHQGNVLEVVEDRHLLRPRVGTSFPVDGHSCFGRQDGIRSR